MEAMTTDAAEAGTKPDLYERMIAATDDLPVEQALRTTLKLMTENMEGMVSILATDESPMLATLGLIRVARAVLAREAVPRA